MKKNKHRRAHFWIAFTVLCAAALIGWRREMLSDWFWERPPASRPQAASPRASETPAQPALVPLEVFDFEDETSLGKWEQKVFKGKTDYVVEKAEGEGPYLSASSVNSSCGLFMKTRHTAAPELHLSWKWRAREFPKKKNPEVLSSRAQDDFAARVYVIFEASNLFRSDVIEYIWDDHIPEGTVQDSPYSDRIKLFVIRSGPAPEASGGWHTETRNPLEDYMKLFGKAPKNPVGIIALMSDSDNTGSSARADFDQIVFGTKKLNDTNREGPR